MLVLMGPRLGSAQEARPELKLDEQLSPLGRFGPRSADSQPSADHSPQAPAQTPQGSSIEPPLKPSMRLAPTLHGRAARDLPIYVEADKLEGRTDGSLSAIGNARLRRGSLTLRADRLDHTTDNNTVSANGHVRIDRQGDVYTGPMLQFQLDESQGFFLSPQYRFARTGAGGTAERIDFLDDQHVVANHANYTSCTPEDGAEPAWELTTSRVALDFENDVGSAEDAVVRFYGVPILGAPHLSFPLTDQRKSGWLPPSFDINNRGGFEFQMPYYWNIAANHDATLTPTIASLRGTGLDTEFRYLEPRFQGENHLSMLPSDRLRRRDRWLGQASHKHSLPGDVQLHASLLRVSDDDYWRDFSRSLSAETYWSSSLVNLPALTPRLLANEVWVEQAIAPSALGLSGAGVWDLRWFARAQNWQVLRLSDAGDLNPADQITSPYQRAPQIGFTGSGEAQGWQWAVDTQLNYFTNSDPKQSRGTRMHATTRLAYPLEPLGPDSGWKVTPSVRLNSASYLMDKPTIQNSKTATRVIPSFNLDSTWIMERPSRWFDSDFLQTLEPRLQYLRTPYRDQSMLPNFDSSPLDYTFDTIYFDNAFSGADRVSDANQLNMGLTTRIIDQRSGGEMLRLGAVQRYLFEDQLTTPDNKPQTQRLPNLLLLGSTSVIPNWTLSTTLQYNSEANNVPNSSFGARYSPGDWRTVSATFRETRGTNKQLDVGWQWPIAGQAPPRYEAEAGSRSSGDCRGSTWYNVGRFNYNLIDSRVTDSLFGIEYDGGCWVGRLVAERVSTGQSEATTRLMFQLELVGLSRLGSSPLRALKDNIPGYRLLRDVRGVVASPETPEPFSSADD